MSKIELLSIPELINLPKPDWLIWDWLPTHTLAALTGPSGAYKSFVALDIGLSIATDTYWHGNEVKPGPVIYIAAEGGLGIRKRVNVWLDEHEIDPDSDIPFYVCPVPVNAGKAEELTELSVQIRDVLDKEDPALIIIDTVARCMVGLEENSATDMGKVIDMTSKLVRSNESGCSVLYVHHTGHEHQGRARGSSAFYAALDVELFLRKTGKWNAKLMNTKMKDAAPMPPKRVILDKRGELPFGWDDPSSLIVTDLIDWVDKNEVAQEERKERLNTILDWMRNWEGTKTDFCEQAAEYFEVSPKTIWRDLKELGL